MMILCTLCSNIFIIRIIRIIIDNKKIKQYLGYGIKIIHFMGSNKYIIAKIKCSPVFKQDPRYSPKKGRGASEAAYYAQFFQFVFEPS